MLRKLVKDGSLYTLSSLLSRGISLFLLPLYVRQLTQEEFGLYDLILLLVNFINLTFSLEITQAVARYLPAFRLQKAKVSLLSTALWIVIGSYGAFFLSYILLKPVIISQVYQTNMGNSLYYTSGVYMVLNGLFLFLQNNLRWNLQSKSFAINSLLYTFVNVASLIGFVFQLKLGLIGVLYANITASLIAILSSYISLRRFYSLYFSVKYARKLISFSYPLIFSSVSVYFSLFIDRIIINKYLGLTELAVFGVAYRFATLVGLITVGLSSALAPLIYKDPYAIETKNTLAKLFYYFISLSFLFILSITVFSREILTLFTTPEYYGAEKIMGLLSASVVFSSMYMFFPGLSIEAKTKYLAIINTVTAFFNLGLCLLLIQDYGIQGVVISTLITAILSFALNAYWGSKFYHQKIAWHIVVLILLVVLLAFTTHYALSKVVFLEAFSWKLMLMKMGLIASATVLLYALVNKRIQTLTQLNS